MRTFISYPIPKNVVERLAATQQLLQREYPTAAITWTNPTNFHVTMVFLGDITDEECTKVNSILAKTIKSEKRFRQTVESISAFPSIHKPRMLVAQVIDHDKSGFLITEKLKRAIAGEGILFDTKPWIPHITIGRKNKSGCMNNVPVPIEPLSWEVSEIHMMKSELANTGPTYTTLHSYSLL